MPRFEHIRHKPPLVLAAPRQLIVACLVIGNERAGLEPEELDRLDRVAVIPMAGLPHSLNAATSASIAVYEYCRQWPAGGGAA